MLKSLLIKFLVKKISYSQTNHKTKTDTTQASDQFFTKNLNTMPDAIQHRLAKIAYGLMAWQIQANKEWRLIKPLIKNKILRQNRRP